MTQALQEGAAETQNELDQQTEKPDLKLVQGLGDTITKQQIKVVMGDLVKFPLKVVMGDYVDLPEEDPALPEEVRPGHERTMSDDIQLQASGQTRWRSPAKAVEKYLY